MADKREPNEAPAALEGKALAKAREEGSLRDVAPARDNRAHLLDETEDGRQGNPGGRTTAKSGEGPQLDHPDVVDDPEAYAHDDSAEAPEAYDDSAEVPARSAVKADWVDFRAGQGYDTDGLTKDELVALDEE